jgi:L-lactate dehydrogenase complex protein LldG
LGIAELGTIVQDANSVHKRLVSMLPPTHLAVISTKTIVETFADSLEVIEKVYNGNPSNFLAFVTGPSKTADIERVLTIGVHGPGRLIVVCVD